MAELRTVLFVYVVEFGVFAIFKQRNDGIHAII
jgi:hypothetical protein